MADAGRLAFALRGCRDLLEKLRYETGGLNTTERHDVTGSRLYRLQLCRHRLAHDRLGVG